MGINFTDISPSQYRDVDIRKMRTVMASVISASGRKKVLVLGDSTEMARGAGSGGTAFTNARVHSPSNVWAARMNSLGIPARADAWFGNANANSGSAADYTSYNPNVSFGAGWSGLLNNSYLGGAFWQNSTTTNGLVFTPERAADRFDIYFIKATGSGNGQFTVTDGATTLATIDENVGTFAIYKQTVTRASATTDPISIQRNGVGGNIHCLGIDPWNSTLPELCILNAAKSGAGVVDVINTGNVLYASFAITLIAADYHIIEYGLNEKQGGVALATFLANLQTLYTSTIAIGGTAGSVSAPATNGDAYDLTSDWRSGINALALTNGIPCIDHYSRFVSREADTSVYFDTVHQNALGYAIKGLNLARFAMSASA
jgi:hypothetical protein